MDGFEIKLETLKAAAKREDWESVDSAIATVTGDPRYWGWAFGTGVRDADGNVRDLAVSIIERSDIPKEEFSKMRGALYTRMMKDDNLYVRFRSAFALANHGPGQYKETVIGALKLASKDDDVKEIAKGYLNRIGHKRVTG